MKSFFHPSSLIPRHRLCRCCHHIHSSFIFYSPSFTDAAIKFMSFTIIHVIQYRECPPSFIFYSLSSADAAIIFMPEGSKDQMGGTMRLGARTTVLQKGKTVSSSVSSLYFFSCGPYLQYLSPARIIVSRIIVFLFVLFIFCL